MAELLHKHNFILQYLVIENNKNNQIKTLQKTKSNLLLTEKTKKNKTKMTMSQT